MVINKDTDMLRTLQTITKRESACFLLTVAFSFVDVEKLSKKEGESFKFKTPHVSARILSIKSDGGTLNERVG